MAKVASDQFEAPSIYYTWCVLINTLLMSDKFAIIMSNS